MKYLCVVILKSVYIHYSYIYYTLSNINACIQTDKHTYISACKHRAYMHAFTDIILYDNNDYLMLLIMMIRTTVKMLSDDDNDDVLCGARWCRGMFGALQPEGCGFESTSRRYVWCLAAGGLRVRIHLKPPRRDHGH